MMKKPGTDYVRIVRDGEMLYEFDLAHTEERFFDIEYGGSVNRVEIKGYRIRMAIDG